MHKQLRSLLDQAEGISEYIIAVNVDIRGFSEFSKQVESQDTAMYIKKVYMRLVDTYLTESSFFKPTGDGLLLTFPYKENSLKEVFTTTINKCWKTIRAFPKICADDPMINFAVPQNIGIGLARGTACRIVSGKKVLDYSGHVLNLASRLMDLARPSGIVFSDQFGANLLDAKELEKFTKTKVYLKGIAEEQPISIFYSKELTKIPTIHKAPLNKIVWEKIEGQKAFSEIRQLGNFHYKLKSRVVDPDEIVVQASFDKIVQGKKVRGVTTLYTPKYQYKALGDEYYVIIDMPDLAKFAKSEGLTDNLQVNLTIKYPTKKTK